MTDKLDLNDVLGKKDHDLTVKIEKVEKPAEMFIRLFKDVIAFLVGIATILFVGSICYETLHAVPGSPEEKKWAMSVVSAMFGGVMTYVMKGK